MRRALMCRWWEKNSKPFVALLAAGAALAMATLIDASSSTQVEQFGPLVVPRTGHAATVLADGRVLITGGRDGAGTIVAIAEIFDPATETSTAVGALVTARVSQTATLLPNDRVLIAGGTGATGSLSSAEIFDPANPGAAFRVLSATMGAARGRHTATLLKDGTVLIAGGDVAGTAEIFDPTTETFSSTLLTMAAPRIGHTATLFSNDSVLLAGGNTDSMELFTPADQKFTLDSQVMSAVHTGQEAISLSDTRLFFFGGDALNTIEEFNPSADTLTVDGTMDAPASSTTLLANGKILVLRPDLAGLYEPDAVAPNPAFTAFDETSVPGSSILLRNGQTATELPGDKTILVTGGANANNLLITPVAVFNPARIWTDKDDYQPNDPVILSGSGWKANENVYLYAVDDETEAWTYGSTVAADASGAFSVNPYFIVQMAQLGANFSVSAVGAQSAMQADVKFTDSITLTSVNVGSQVGSLSAGTAGTATFPVCVNYNGNNSTIAFSVISGLPAGVSASFSPNNISNPVKCPTNATTLTLTTTAATPAGTYAFTVQATGGGTVTGTGTLIVPGPAAKYVVASSDNNPVAGSGVTITAQLADAAGNAVFTAGKIVTWSKTGTGAGSFSSPTSTTNSSGLATVTLTTDTTAGKTHQVTATDNSTPTHFTGISGIITTVPGAASKLLLSGSTADLTAGATRQLTATIEDANNNIVTTGADSSLSVTFAKTAGTGTVTGLGSATASAGVATLTVTGNAPGSITITASATGSAGALTPGSGNPITFNVVTGAASKLALSGSTANLTAGATRTLTATIQDSAGNTITTGSDSTLSVTFAKTAGVGNVSGLNSVNAVAGVASLTVTGTTAGSVTITASGTGSGGALTAGTGNPITFSVIANTTVDHFAFAAISSPQTSGIAFNITITAEDAGNNTVTGYSGNGFKVKLTSTGTLVGAPVTTPAFTNGVLNNQSVTITNTGNFTITATDNSGSTSATGTSNSFQVNPGAAAKLALTGSTANLASGSTRTLTATIQDTNGNTVATGADSTLSVTFAKTNIGGGSVTGLGSSTTVAGVATLTVT